MKTITLTLSEEAEAWLKEDSGRRNWTIDQLLEYYVASMRQKTVEFDERIRLAKQLQSELNRPEAYDAQLMKDLEASLTDGLENR